MALILGRKGGGGGGGAPSGPAGGDLAGTYPNPTIAADAVGSDEIAANAVGSSELADDAVTAAKLAPSAATPTDGWVDDTAATWTRTANQTFTVPGDRTAVFTKGTRLKWTQTTVKYGVVVASSHAAGTTTVTIATTTDYVLTAAAISENFYSYMANPQGYPDWFAYTPTYTGFSGGVSTEVGRFAVVGRTCMVALGFQGTSNATTTTVTLPIAPLVARSNGTGSPRCFNSGAFDADHGTLVIAAANAVVTVGRGGGNLAWTASGTKGAWFDLAYEI